MFKTILPTAIHKQKNRIARLPNGGDSLFLANLATKLKTPFVYVVNDGYQAQRLAGELAFFAPELRLAQLPGYDVLPYERQSSSTSVIAERLKTLWQIQHGQLDILLIQAQTVQSFFPPQEYFNSRVLMLKPGDILNLEQLRSQLTQAGYQCVNQVYEFGEFAIRGSILDIIPQGSKEALRIDFFDDEIESIHLFDSKSQMTYQSIDRVEILPTREYPYDAENIRRMLARFVDYFPKESDSTLAKDIRHNLLPAGVEFYLPLFFDNCATLFDYLDSRWQVVFADNLHSQLNLHWQEVSKRYDYYNYQYPCLKTVDLFLPADRVFESLKKHTVWEIAVDGDFYSHYGELPDVIIDNKARNPFEKIATLSGKKSLIIVCESLGRQEILRQTLTRHDLIPKSYPIEFNEKTPGIYLAVGELNQGFIYQNYLFIAESDFYASSRLIRKRPQRSRQSVAENDLILRDMAEIATGDLVVHINHGVGRYIGMSRQVIADMEYEMLEIEYQNNAKMYLPVHNLHLLSRYSHLEGTSVELTKLGSKQWDKIKTKTEQQVSDLAAELLELYAKREMQCGHAYSLPAEYSKFAGSFGYEPTRDQEQAFSEIIKDLTAAKPMDRLVCGDVGFGKTEVAMRAAFIAALNGFQVAILAPTTLLTEQLYQNFVDRFAGFAVNIAEISRFKSKKEVTQTLELLALGKVDIIVGTHRLIQEDIKFSKLGLVIIDEEHRFGVKQKERLKQMRANVDILTMTATPIPRTLSMALDGLRDFSIIATPPSRRLPVNTLLVPEDNSIISEAIIREIRRGGQVFFLYNDVASIERMYQRLQELIPELRIAIAHGQMPENELERTIKDFIRQRYNLLLCSTIIETGIDIPNANTILIYRADKFGLAQLHQLRGRVGRSHHQAYCYLLVPERTTKDAEKRLDAILATTELGAGFNLAMHDLEIRGAGEILGDHQAGNIKEVGLSLYTEMLKKAIRKLKHGEKLNGIGNDEINCEVNLNYTAIIPVDYCNSVQERLIFYKRLARAEDDAQLDLVYQELIDSYGLPPESVKTLIIMHQLRINASLLGIRKIDAGNGSINLVFIDQPPIEPLQIVLTMQQLKTCKYDGKNKLIWTVKSDNLAAKVSNLEKIFQLLSVPLQ